jgi:hypothetical protein
LEEHEVVEGARRLAELVADRRRDAA